MLHFMQRLKRAISDPAHLRETLLVRIKRFPFVLGIQRVWPEANIVNVPDRFLNPIKYRESVGVHSRESLSDFMAGNKVYNGGDITRYYFLTLAADQIIKEGIIGNTAELGVYKGNTASILVKLARLTGTDAYLFDTYEGFSSRDLDGIDADESMAFEDTSLENVVRLVGEEKTHFVKGHFPGTINQIPDNLVFSFVHIDCDLYAPFKDALEYFYPRLTRGGMLVMHDYSSLRWKGAEKAIDDFFSDKPEFVIPIPDKSGSAVIRKL